ncbi:hypothetical protein DSM106972_041490 [Dulcicalothrix desertica PCC 7102]|uniref:Aldehyde dehydrogenase domain-containing protein n=1 Tax=Dulcicalothrix desertica PCC 7102 TaxID=232991 RepID=A0A3S1AMA9_9CYAN|nr:hypothetical protein DSM106972_041490 [Dulcicalothrix desertica PCC 7102]
MALHDQLVSALVDDTGRLSISNLEVDSFLSSIDRWSQLAPKILQETLKDTSIPFIQLQQTTVPYQLVGVISPWNFPLLLSTIDAIPALLAGCAVIIKRAAASTVMLSIPIIFDMLNFI